MRNNDTTPEPDAEPGFYRRWSKRKQQARSGHPPTPCPPQPPAVNSPAGGLPEPDPGSQPPPLTDADMPPLENLDGDSDYSGFLSEGVSEELRNKALRKLFLSPQFNVVDGLDDYCEDFTNFEVLGDIVTADMRHERELQAERARERAQQEQQAAAGEPEARDQAAPAAAGEAPAGEAGIREDSGDDDDRQDPGQAQTTAAVDPEAAHEAGTPPDTVAAPQHRPGVNDDGTAADGTRT